MREQNTRIARLAQAAVNQSKLAQSPPFPKGMGGAARPASPIGAGGSPSSSSVYLDTRSLSDDKPQRGSERDERLRRLSGSRERSLDLGVWLRQNVEYDEREAYSRRLEERLLTCGRWVQLQEVPLGGSARIVGGNFCNIYHLCASCAHYRSIKMASAYRDRFWAVKEARYHQYGKVYPVMITLTVKDGPDLQERFDHLCTSLRKAWNWGAQRRRRGLDGGEFGKIVGACGQIEIKRGERSGEWHPHIHLAALLSGYINLKRFSKEWQARTGDSCVVDVRLMRRDWHSRESLLADFVEVFKYPVKIGGMDFADLWDAYKVCFGKRMIRAYGELYGVVEVDGILEQPLNDEELWFLREYRARGTRYERVKQTLCWREGNEVMARPMPRTWSDTECIKEAGNVCKTRDL